MGVFKTFSDTSLIEGLRKQDDKVLNWLYENYLPAVRSYIFNNNGTAEDVSDVFQDAIIALYTQIKGGTLKLESDLKGYFFGIARRIWINKARKELKTTVLEFEIAEEEDTEESNKIVLERIINRVFHKLKPDEQMVLNLIMEGYSYEEIAVKMEYKNEVYARRKKYLCKEVLLDLLREDPEYQEYSRFLK
jgi:RNA polymerase sigma factor (sigma-70 family)